MYEWIFLKFMWTWIFRSSRNVIHWYLAQRILSAILCCEWAFKFTFHYAFIFGWILVVQSVYLCCQTFRRIRFHHHRYNIITSFFVWKSLLLYLNTKNWFVQQFLARSFLIMYQPFISGRDVTLLAQWNPVHCVLLETKKFEQYE
jgi:hypothetical protein